MVGTDEVIVSNSVSVSEEQAFTARMVVPNVPFSSGVPVMETRQYWRWLARLRRPDGKERR